jgi:haloalkane dehalogenase
MVQDWGGPVGLGFAGRAPERIRALVIGNTWAWPVNGDKHFERFSALTGGWFGGLMIRHFNAFVNLILRTSVERKKLSRAEMNAYRGPFPTPAAREPTHIFPQQIIGAKAYLAEVEQNLETLKAKPMLLVWGDKDPAFRLQERQRFEGIFATHRTVELPGSGHYIQEDAPDEIAQAIARWWDEIVAQLA